MLLNSCPRLFPGDVSAGNEQHPKGHLAPPRRLPLHPAGDTPTPHWAQGAIPPHRTTEQWGGESLGQAALSATHTWPTHSQGPKGAPRGKEQHPHASTPHLPLRNLVSQVSS